MPPAGAAAEVPDPDSRPPAVRNTCTQRGGLTALVTYAVLPPGESQQDARIRRALDYLKKTEITGIYALGMCCQVWTFLYRTEEYRALIKKDATALVAAAKPVAGVGAFYRYSLTSTDYDHSASQYGVLGAGRWPRRASRFRQRTGKPSIPGGGHTSYPIGGGTTEATEPPRLA